jgi:AmmeMemoRadiSam system protein B
MSAHLTYPRLRPGLAVEPDDDPRFVLLWDRLRLVPHALRLSRVELLALRAFDGQRTLREIQTETVLQAGTILPRDLFTNLVARLDTALFLDSPAFRTRLNDPIREPACIGCYAGEAAPLREQLRAQFTDPRGPGLPREGAPTGTLRAALVPHIDYQRGGWSFAWGFREIFEQADASLFVIVGTSHYSAARFTLTRKHFKTPLGVVPTDQAAVDLLVNHYGDGLFNDPFAHLPEHSIELEVVFLQFLYEGRRSIRIVPLLVGTFQDCVANSIAPREQPDIGRMIGALRALEAAAGEPICYVISGDLAHIGPKFGDASVVAEPWLSASRAQDQRLLEEAEAVRPDGYCDIVVAEQDARRICGFPPTYLVLEAIKPHAGRLLHYEQHVAPTGQESVSFASVGFRR